METLAGLANRTHEKQLSHNYQMLEFVSGDMSRRRFHMQHASNNCRRNAGCASPRLSF